MLTAFFAVCYFLLSIPIVWGWYYLKENNEIQHINKQNAFSIVVAMRNESANISKLLASLKQLDYPKNAYEIILVDDCSTDNSVSIAQHFGLSSLKVISSEGKGKKMAVQTGISHAKYDYIVQTDADCQVPVDWLKVINNQVIKFDCQLIAAPLVMKDADSIFSKLQALESYALLMTTAGLFGCKRPVMLNAANVVYQKKLFKEPDILNHQVVSGDDVFLLHKIKQSFGNERLRFIKGKQVTITTKAELNFRAFVQQRIRWAGKSKYYRDTDTIFVGLLIMAVNLSIVLMLLLGIFYRSILEQALDLWLVKFILEFLMLIPVLKSYQKCYLLSYVPLLTLIYPFYVSFVGILSPFVKIKWKNRVYNGA